MTGPLRKQLRWRHPVAHFVVIGAMLFALRNPLQRAVEGVPAPAPRAPVVISAERIRLMQSDFAQRWGTVPTTPQLRAMVERTIEEEILYREARVLALDFGDGSIRRRLVEKARAITQRSVYTADELYQEALTLGLDDDPVVRRLLAEKMRLFLQHEPSDAPISDTAMIEYMQRNHARFVQPETVTLTHVFFSRVRRERLAGDAAAAAKTLTGQPPSPAVMEQSDPFPLGHELHAYTPRQLTARFGKPFADQILALPTGSWSPPLTSPYGLHLVWVHQHEPERLPPLNEVRETVELALMQERAARNQQIGLARLRSLYEARVEGSL